MLGFLFSAAFVQGQNIPVIKIGDLVSRINSGNDTLYVVNFWATWCGPCVHELPGFEEAQSKFKDQKVKFLLVSLDFKNELEKRVVPFVQKKGYTMEFVLIDEPDYNSWIDKIAPEWGGAIPATLFTRSSDKARSFTEGEINSSDLSDKISALIKDIK